MADIQVLVSLFLEFQRKQNITGAWEIVEEMSQFS